MQHFHEKLSDQRALACPPPKLYDNEGNVPKCPKMSHFHEIFSDKQALALLFAE